jgi:O-antigen/teichoic acid export membrane protein
MLAREMSRTAMWFNVFSRYLSFALVIGMIYFFMRSAMGAYLARIVAGAFALIYLVRWARIHCEFDRKAFSPAILKESFSFGMPLVVSEISLILLAFVDRVVLKHFTGSFSQVGIYTIGYSLAMYVGIFMRSSLLSAYQPVVNRVYETQGSLAFLSLQRRMMRVMIYASLSICIGLYFVGQDVLVLFAGRDKAAAGPVFQWIGANYVCTPLFAVAAYGLTLRKRTRLISVIVVSSTLLNLGLNFLWIPRYGIMGAVYATLVSYLLMWSTQVVCSPRELWPRLRAGDLLRPLVCGVLFIACAWGTHLFGLEQPIPRLLVFGAIFVASFILPALALDAELRDFFRQKMSAFLPQRFR